jgi:hypothetical protein
MTQTVLNLSELLLSLDADGTHPKLAKAIRRAIDVSSAHRDLDEALLALRLLRRMTRANDDTPIADDDMSTIVGSLLTAAIIYYARATETRPISRNYWFGVGKLPPELRLVHRELMRLRDKEVAHFGKGEPVDGAPLFADALVLRPFDPGHPISYLSDRTHNRASLARRAEGLVEAVVALAEAAASARQSEVIKLLSPLAESKDPVMARLREMPLKDTRLLTAEEWSRQQPPDPGKVGNLRGVSVVELHDDP